MQVEKLIQLFYSLKGQKRVWINPKKKSFQEAAWQETEEDYQKEQSKWLAKVKKRKQQGKNRSSS